jgi:DNA-binding transcriptional MocR family regulator
MSFTAIRSALHNIKGTSLSPSAKLVLIALANRHNQETGRCDPSIDTIAEDMALSERSVRSAIRELEKEGLISTTHRVRRTGRGKKNLTNRYNLRGGANSAGGVGQILPPKQEVRQPSAFSDLVMILEDEKYG